MSERHVLIRAYGLQFPFNAVVPQSALRMDDAALDEFVAAGYAIDFDPAPPSITPVDLVGLDKTSGQLDAVVDAIADGARLTLHDSPPSHDSLLAELTEALTAPIEARPKPRGKRGG